MFDEQPDDQHGECAAEIHRLEEENKRLRTTMSDAIECVESWACYASPYFQEKHDLAGDPARLKAALAENGG